MNVLLITTLREPAIGGIAVWTKHYLSKCKEHDLNCTVINTERGSRNKSSQWGEFYRTRRIMLDLEQSLNNQCFDIAHLNTSCGPLGLFRDYLLARKIYRKGVPVVTHYHCDISSWINNPLRRCILKKLARLSCLNLVLCENSRDYLKRFHIDSVKVPNFIDDSIIADRPKMIRDICTRIFYVGRISELKGAEEIYELARRFPDKTFVLAGGVVPPVDRWKKPTNIKLTGRLTSNAIIRLLDEADLFLFPSHSEGFSLALMEAMARGVPCIAFDSVGANSDMLADNCGVTVPFKDVNAMEQAMRDLESPSRRKEISKNAVQKVQDYYTTDAVLSLFKELYESKP